MAGGLLDFLGFGGGQQPMQAQTGQPQQGGMFSGRMAALNDPAIALPLAGALMQPGDMGSNLGQGFALAGQGVATRKKLAREQAVENATAKYLEAQGADTGLVELAKSGAGGEALQLFTQMKKRNDLMTVGKNIYDPNTGQWIAAPAGMGGDETEYGLQPIYGQDAQGNTVLGQVSKSGTFKPLDMPEGFKPSTGADKVDLGTQWGIIDRRTGQITQYIPKDVAGEASQKEIGKGQGEATVAYKSVSSKMPGLEAVVTQLDDLADKATYTLSGQVYNAGRRQLGMDPSEGQLARTEYISTVDNQILPLLRDTFGAAFTQKEGDTLRATLGDPDKSPKEKQIILKSFIEQKRRDVEAMARQSNSVPSPQTAPQGGVVDYRDFFGGQ